VHGPCIEVRSDGEGGARGEPHQQVDQGMANMDSEESQDGDALRLHSSHYFHRHEHGSQTPAFAASEPCVGGGHGYEAMERAEQGDQFRGSQFRGGIPSSELSHAKVLSKVFSLKT